jgi:hypothetical protein
VSGAFSYIELPELAAELTWHVEYSPQEVTLRVLSSADFDRDGDVDGDDLLQWKGDFASNGFSDADNDGDSDGADFLTWQRELGSATTVAATAAVPEPVTRVLLAPGALAMILRRRVVVS